MTTSTQAECITAVGAVLAATRVNDVAAAYARGGSRAVAEAAHVTGGKSIAELAEGYERLVRQARERPDAA